MFQYAYALLIKKITNDEVKLDYTAYNLLEMDKIRRPRITEFSLSLQAASQEDIERVCLLKHTGNPNSFFYKLKIFADAKINKKYFFEQNRAYIPPEKLKNYDYFDGYWQSWRYVNEVLDELKNDFTPKVEVSLKTSETKEKIENSNSVFVGVRRGDYLENKKHYGNFGIKYYLKSMEKIEEKIENPVYYIFSNDVEWCKENLQFGKRNIIYREDADQVSDFEELILMTNCKSAIICNSTFNWWGAQLIKNSNKIVCCPSKWFFDDAPIDIVPKEWIRINDN